MAEPSLGLGPIQFTLNPAGTGRVQATDVSVPVPGRWHLVLQLRTGPFDDYSATTTYLVQ